MLFWNLLQQWQNLFFLGPYPVGTTAKTSFPFRRALTAVSCSDFKTILLPVPTATKFRSSNSTSSSNYVNSRGTYCQQLTNQKWKNGGVCSRLSLIPSPQSPIFPAFLLIPSPFPFTPATQARGVTSVYVTSNSPSQGYTQLYRYVHDRSMSTCSDWFCTNRLSTYILQVEKLHQKCFFLYRNVCTSNLKIFLTNRGLST